MKGIGSESKRGVMVGDTTECGRETKQTERQQQGGSWGHSPEIVSKNGARRVRQRQAALVLVNFRTNYKYDILVYSFMVRRSPTVVAK